MSKKHWTKEDHEEHDHFQVMTHELFGKKDTMPKLLPMWVIYDSPADHMGKTVARLWENEKATDQLIEASLEQLRKRFISMGLISIGRFPQDDPAIVEVWI